MQSDVANDRSWGDPKKIWNWKPLDLDMQANANKLNCRLTYIFNFKNSMSALPNLFGEKRCRFQFLAPPHFSIISRGLFLDF